MKLYLYLWTSHVPGGLYIGLYHSWELVAWFIHHWEHPDQIFTVIEEDE